MLTETQISPLMSILDEADARSNARFYHSSTAPIDQERDNAMIVHSNGSHCCDRICSGGPRSVQPTDRQTLTSQHKRIFFEAMNEIAVLKSPQLNREQLVDNFMTSYWTSSVIKSSTQYLKVFQWVSQSVLTLHLDPFQKLIREQRAPQSVVLGYSRDALCLIHLGTQNRDQRLILEGQKRHVDALSCLRNKMDSKDAASDDAVLAAAYTLGHCELYWPISRSATSWKTHVPGYISILETRGPESISSPFAVATLHSLRYVFVMDSLMTRKKSFFARPEWMLCAEKVRSPAVFAVSLGLRTGALLEKADRILSRKQMSTTNTLDVLRQIYTLIDALQRWLNAMYERSNGALIAFRKTSTSEFNAFHQHCGSLADLCPQSYNFPSLLSATCHTYIWICSLLLRQAVLSIVRTNLMAFMPVSSDETKLFADAEDCARSLVESIAYLSNPEYGSAGVIACGGPLYFASAWYEAQDDNDMFSWCEHVRVFLQEGRLSAGSINTTFDLRKPVFTWWMLPDIFAW